MAQQAQLAGRLFWQMCALVSCTAKQSNTSASTNILNKDSTSLVLVNGILMDENKPFNGTVYTLFPGSTDTASISHYTNGRESGEWTQYYTSGQIKERRFFVDGKKSGRYFGWWPNGKKQLQYFFADDNYEGVCREWNDEGALTKVMNYRKGHEEGHQQWWYDDGKIKANYIIKNGRRYGLLGTKNCVNVSDSVFNN